jgi:hypothetical protein
VLNLSKSQFKKKKCRVWWCIPIILALRRLRQEDYEFRPAWATHEPVSKIPTPHNSPHPPHPQKKQKKSGK